MVYRAIRRRKVFRYTPPIPDEPSPLGPALDALADEYLKALHGVNRLYEKERAGLEEERKRLIELHTQNFITRVKELMADDGRVRAAAPKLLKACKSQLQNWKDLLSGEWDGSEEGVRAAIEHLEQVIALAE